MNQASLRDPYLDLPLHGVQLIEASAGTGKTFTLATLVTRLLVERGLRIGQVLAVTFTEAATQELRKRIRERLQLAQALLDAPTAEDDSPEAALTHALLQAHLARSAEAPAALRRRLRLAVLEIDLAAIFTIHGFCARVLREHAMEAGRGFDQVELLGNDEPLRLEIAAELWRNRTQDDAGAEDMAVLWPGGYEQLAKELTPLLREPELLPAAAPLPPDPDRDRDAAAEQLVHAIERHLPQARAQIADAFEHKVLHGARVKRPSFEKAFAELLDGAAVRHWPRSKTSHLGKLLPTELLGFCHEAKRDQVPASPLFDACAAWVEADERMQRYLALRQAELLHRLRDEARARLAGLKRQRRLQTYDDLIDGVADALSGANGAALAASLRQQYAVALVDEFQDTDARQWAIFEHVFGREAPALFLIGDPKQAIYRFRGGDVHTYLGASAQAALAPPLSHNFRSRPALLRAIAALYANADNRVSTHPEIRFHPVAAGDNCADADFQRNGSDATALTLWQAPAPEQVDAKGRPRPYRATVSRGLATQACVAAIHARLSDARRGEARVKDRETRALRALHPGDIAVLVRSHAEATQMQQALARVGIAAVAAGKQSLFATAEAHELQIMLLALLHSGDEGRLRAALSTVLIGLDAGAIAALDHDPNANLAWQHRAQAWRERLLRGGPLALVNDLAAEHAPRLLGLLDGERRVSNYLQLAELLQEARPGAPGLHGWVEWLGRRIQRADPNDDAQLLRLESDARRVQIVTLHKSKGLEYPLVFLPYVGIGRKDGTPGRHCVAHDPEAGRRLHWKLELPESEWAAASQRWQQEQRAEDARLLYVGLTRAEHALWIATGAFHANQQSPLAPMLSDPASLAAAGIVFDAEPPAALLRLAAQHEREVPPARIAQRTLHGDWWVHSFSQWARADSGEANAAATLPASGGSDEPEVMPDPDPMEARFDARFSGNRYGVALHAALERADLAAWRDWHDGDAAPDNQASVIAAALRREGYADDVLDDGVALSTRLIGHTLTVVLPEGARLCDVPSGEHRAEIEFQFALQSTQADALLRLLHDHDVVRGRDRFGARQRLEGLMTGLIDLTYRHAGQWYVLDYKSNRLPNYDAASLAQAMTHSEYDLQALIYTLALHRWLRFRLGADYDYARDFGGIRYLFCRGLDAARRDSPGIHAQRFAPELVHALDALFGIPADEAAA